MTLPLSHSHGLGVTIAAIFPRDRAGLVALGRAAKRLAIDMVARPMFDETVEQILAAR